MQEANEFLPSFLNEYNRRFGVRPKSSEDAHRPLLASQDMDSALVIEETRTLSKTLTFQYDCVLYQVCEPKLVNRLKNQRVTIQLDLSGEMQVVSRWGQRLRFTDHQQPSVKVQRTVDSKDLARLWADKKHKPKKHHPWR